MILWWLLQVGGNRKAREFLEAQDDWDDSLPFTQKYNSRACALLREKVRMTRMKSAFHMLKMTILPFKSYHVVAAI